MPGRLKAKVLRPFVLLLLFPVGVVAFVLTELTIQIELDPDQPYTLDLSNLGVPNTGFTLFNRDQEPASLSITTAYDSDLGLEQGDALQESFLLYDGTLFLEVAASEPSGRANVRTTYRMNVDPRMLEARALSARFVRQGLTQDPRRAQGWARATRLSDARIMRFVEGRADGRWIRAVRAIDDVASADVRFMGRRSPDGVLGHHGYDTNTDGTSYVWAVTDTNSRYGVGLTIDRDDDGVANADDNCPDVANSSQNDFDADFMGDACDDDDDNDLVSDAVDNCPLASNQDQADIDGDGLGDVCDTDNDNDTVDDGLDVCLGTAFGATVDAQGCSIADRCPCENDWRNHGGYVRCVAHTSRDFVTLGLITPSEKDAIVSAAAESSCGIRQR